MADVNNNTTAYFIVVRYKKRAIPMAVMAMALFHLTLFINKQVHFYKLMGCGRNGTFDIKPDWQQWCMCIVTTKEINSTTALDYIHKLAGGFITWYLKTCSQEQCIIALTPVQTHGLWDGANPFNNINNKVENNRPIAVLTRATIRLKRMKNFWAHVQGVADKLQQQPGFIYSIGIGEIPWKKQATLSFWDSLESMKGFAYKQKEHAVVIKKTKAEQWYSEDMFTRFYIKECVGTVNGVKPL